MRLVTLRWWWVTLVLIPMTLCAQSKQPSTEHRHDEFSMTIDASFNLPDQERARVIEQKYDELFPIIGVESLVRTRGDDLELLYRSALNAARLTPRRDYVQHAELMLHELEARGMASNLHYSYLYGLYIQRRMLEEAGKLFSQHPSSGLDAMPELRVSGTLAPGLPTELAVSPDVHELLRRSVDIYGPGQVVVVAHPSCNFSKVAMFAIASDPIMASVFRANAKWLAPADFSFDFDVIRRWNAKHPNTAVTLVYKPSEWPMVDSWNTPTFYFLRDGKVVAKVAGWPKEGRRDELLAAARQVGLLAADQ